MYKIKDFSYFFQKTDHKYNFQEYVELFNVESRHIYLNSLTPQNADSINKIIQMWNKKDEKESLNFAERVPIKIFINSNGGDFNAMLTLMDIIRLSKTPIETINMGICYREAFFVFLAGHKRYAYPKSSFMFEKDLKHLEEANEKMPENYMNFYNKQLNELKDILLERTKVTESEYNKHLKNSWWITADESQKLKICNEIFYNF